MRISTQNPLLRETTNLRIPGQPRSYLCCFLLVCTCPKEFPWKLSFIICLSVSSVFGLISSLVLTHVIFQCFHTLIKPDVDTDRDKFWMIFAALCMVTFLFCSGLYSYLVRSLKEQIEKEFDDAARSEQIWRNNKRLMKRLSIIPKGVVEQDLELGRISRAQMKQIESAKVYAVVLSPEQSCERGRRKRRFSLRFSFRF